jgi:uncharacterized protein (TIGR02147 family)
VKRPDPFTYHDLVIYLKDVIEYKRESDANFSIREFARASGVANGYISNILKGTRKLSTKGLQKLLPVLDVTKLEEKYLFTLCRSQASTSTEDKVEALRALTRFKQFRNLNKKEAEVFRYFTNWYYPVIRELSALPAFELKAEWIQQKLKYSVSLVDIERALEFLQSTGMIEVSPDGKVGKPDKLIEARGEVMRPALMRFHGQMFDLAKLSMEKTPRELRNISGQTMPIPLDKFQDAAAIMDKALDDIAALTTNTATNDAVYHFAVVAFPLTKLMKKRPG